MQFLSDDWVAALDAAAKTVEVEPDTSIVIEQTVRRDGPDVIWHSTVAEGSIRLTPGAAAGPDVRLSCDSATASAISTGRLSAQRAFLDGRLHLDGDVRALMEARPALDVLADVFASVRADTIELI